MSRLLAEAIAGGLEMVITHGNGPQVGNLLAKNEIAASTVPAVSLHWCVAQTQATIGLELASTMSAELSALGISRPVIPILTRVSVDPSDPAFELPTKMIGRYVASEGRPDLPLPDQHRWVEAKPGWWRRSVPSPRPVAIVDHEPITLALSAGAVVIACGGGGVPVTFSDGQSRGVEAVIDKDLTASLLGELVQADRLVILTDVEGAATDFGSSEENLLGVVDVSEMTKHLHDGQFGTGTMESKVRAAVEFVQNAHAAASIGSLDDARAVIDGTSGTRIVEAV